MPTRPPDVFTTLQPTSPRTAELDRLGDQIAEFSAHLDAATARLLALAPALGELSYAKVRALTRVATAETEARLLAVGRAGTAVHVERIVRGWRRVDRQAEAREAARQHAGRALHVYQDAGGTVALRGRLAPEVGALLLRALDAAREALYQRRRATEAARPATDPAAAAPTRAQQQVDALALLAETALHQELVPGSRPRRCRRAGGSGATRPIRAGRGEPRSRGNVAAAGVRREPGGDAAR